MKLKNTPHALQCSDTTLFYEPNILKTQYICSAVQNIGFELALHFYFYHLCIASMHCSALHLIWTLRWSVPFLWCSAIVLHCSAVQLYFLCTSYPLQFTYSSLQHSAVVVLFALPCTFYPLQCICCAVDCLRQETGRRSLLQLTQRYDE